MAKVQPPAPTGVTPIPREWVRSLSVRPPDFRALTATWTDPVARRKGLSIYEEMLADPQVASSLDLLKFAPLSLEWNLKPPKNKEKDAKINKALEAVQEMLESWPGGWHEYVYQLLTALEYGYSITENQWGERGGRWVVEDWVTLPQALYGFEMDMQTAKPVGVRTQFTPMSQEKVYPLENFVVLRWNSRYGAPYGRSQLLRAYESWWMKQLIRRMRNTTLDRFGTPLIGAKVPDNTPLEDRKRLREFIEGLYAEAGIVYNASYQIEAIHQGAGQGASQGFQAAIEYEDSQIAKAITGVTLNANESTGTGTYAQAKVHQDNFLYWVRRVALFVQEVVQRQVVNRLAYYNFGLDEGDAPRFTIASPEGEDLTLAQQVVQGAQQLGVIVPHLEFGWIRERLGLPPADEEVAEAVGQMGDMQMQQQAQAQQAQQAQLGVQQGALGLQQQAQQAGGDAPQDEDPADPWEQQWLRSYAGGELMRRRRQEALEALGG